MTPPTTKGLIGAEAGSTGQHADPGGTTSDDLEQGKERGLGRARRGLKTNTRVGRESKHEASSGNPGLRRTNSGPIRSGGMPDNNDAGTTPTASSKI